MVRPVLARSLFRESILLEQRNDLRVEQFIGLHHLDWYRHCLLALRLVGVGGATERMTTRGKRK